jgi:hypothetical protein
MVLTTLSLPPAIAAGYSEKTQYLGVVNGQMVGNSVVKVTRTLSDPVLYRSDDATTPPPELRVRNAEVRQASGGMGYITVKQALPDNREARLTLKTALIVDGNKSAFSALQQGQDVLITVPEPIRQLELRTDAPVELEIPANYRGNVQIALQVED